jgi:hypothetical protein
MITIPAITVQMPDGIGGTVSVQKPATPPPLDMTASTCIGDVYTFYQPGDALPAEANPTEAPTQ